MTAGPSASLSRFRIIHLIATNILHSTHYRRDLPTPLQSPCQPHHPCSRRHRRPGVGALAEVRRQTCDAAPCRRQLTLDPHHQPNDNQARAIKLPIDQVELRGSLRERSPGDVSRWRARTRIPLPRQESRVQKVPALRELQRPPLGPAQQGGACAPNAPVAVSLPRLRRTVFGRRPECLFLRRRSRRCSRCGGHCSARFGRWECSSRCTRACRVGRP